METAPLVDLLRHPVVVQALAVAGLGLACLAVHFVLRRVLVGAIERLVLRSRTGWDDALQQAEVFRRLVALVPAALGWYGIHLLPGVGETVQTIVSRVAMGVIVLFVGRAVIAFLSAANAIYVMSPEYRDRPIKGYVQVVQIAVGIVTALIVFVVLLDRSPVILLSGIGAMTAVMLLIFRDTILSLVESVQLSGQDMVRVGDWIEMPRYGADGSVIDVALHTVKVENWDKTVTTIPTHALISESFKNWRFMSLSGGRRIKRAMHVDVNSVRFLDDGEVERFRRVDLLREYIERKTREIADYNRRVTGSGAVNANVRRLTNLGTFRAYVEQYLRHHPRIHHDGMTLLVRHRDPGPVGIPIEVYCFTATTAWAEYEGIQSDLFDHFFAIAPDFGLRMFQSPSGWDVRSLAGASGEAARP